MPNAKYVIESKIDNLIKKLGPREYLKLEGDRIEVIFRDTTTYYGNNAEVEKPVGMTVWRRTGLTTRCRN